MVAFIVEREGGSGRLEVTIADLAFSTRIAITDDADSFFNIQHYTLDHQGHSLDFNFFFCCGASQIFFIFILFVFSFDYIKLEKFQIFGTSGWA